MAQVIVGRWGKNLAIRLPNEVVKQIGLLDGDRVEIEPQGSDFVVRPRASRISAQQLFEGKTAQEWRAEYAGAYEWGPDLGQEVVDQ